MAQATTIKPQAIQVLITGKLKAAARNCSGPWHDLHEARRLGIENVIVTFQDSNCAQLALDHLRSSWSALGEDPAILASPPKPSTIPHPDLPLPDEPERSPAPWLSIPIECLLPRPFWSLAAEMAKQELTTRKVEERILEAVGCYVDAFREDEMVNLEVDDPEAGISSRALDLGDTILARHHLLLDFLRLLSSTSPKPESQATVEPADDAETDDPGKIQIYSFSKEVAKTHGEPAALILKHLVYMIKRSKNRRQGKQWHYESIEGISKKFLFLGKTAVADALKKLRQKKILLTGTFNKRGYDKTLWYAVGDEKLAERAGKNLIYFRADHATKYGLVEAVLIRNMVHWIRENRGTKPEYQWHQMSPTVLAKHLPFSRTTIGRALEHLVEQGVLGEAKGKGLDKKSSYRFLDETQFLFEKPANQCSDPEIDCSKPAMDCPKTTKDCSKPGYDCSNPHTYTYYVDSVGDSVQSKVGRESSRESSASPSPHPPLSASQSKPEIDFSPKSDSCHPDIPGEANDMREEAQGKELKAQERMLMAQRQEEAFRKLERDLKERQEKYASPDKKKEEDCDLSAEEKARVFKNAVFSRNRIGEIDQASMMIQPLHLRFTKLALRTAERFFAKNSSLPVSGLLEVLDASLEGPSQSIWAEERDEGVQGHNLTKFFARLPRIVCDVSDYCDAPPMEFLESEEIFDKKTEE